MRSWDRMDLVQFSLIFLAFLGLMLLGGLMLFLGSEPKSSDELTIRDLNDKYVDAFLKSDVGWYRAMLADDFVCIDSDGSLLHKKEFLDQAARGPDVAYYKLQEVIVRFYGDVAVVQATGRFIRKDSSMGLSRYTDVTSDRGKIGEWCRPRSLEVLKTLILRLSSRIKNKSKGDSMAVVSHKAEGGMAI
jgi:ketosteroid isomerase-like protein